jgi:predicted permease
MWINRQDLLYSLRSARRAPLLSLVAVIALTLGIGLNAGVFTLLNALLLAPPTGRDPASFVQAYPRYEGWFTGSAQYSTFTSEDYEAIRSQSHGLQDVAAWQPSGAVLEQGPKRVGAVLVDCSYFHVFGFDQPQLGRFFNSTECQRDARPQVAVLSEAFWKSKFGANPHIVGRVIHLNGLPFQIVGVVSADAANYLAGGIFIPYTARPLLDRSHNLLASPDTPWLQVAGRLRPGYSKTEAAAELETIMRRQDRAYLQRKVSAFNRRTSIVLTNGSIVANPAFHHEAVAMMGLILGPLSLVLLLACCNVTMLFLSKAVVRRGEIAIRLALGVGQARLARMLLLESLLMALLAGAMSVAVAYRVPLIIMNAINPEQSGAVPQMHPDWRVFGFTAALIAIATVVSSLAPMHAAWKLDLLTALKGREGAATVRSRSTSGLIIAQVAMSFVLLAAAVLFARLPGIITGMDPGFDTRHTMSVPLDVDTHDHTKALDFYSTVEARLAALPNVQSFAYATLQPFRQTPPLEIRTPGQTEGQGRPASVDVVSQGFFATFGVRLVNGRAFAAADLAGGGATSVSVVSQAFADHFWPGANPIGKVAITPDGWHLTIIGVAADTRSERFGVLDGPRLYTLRDPGSLDGELYVRFTGSASNAERTVRDAVKALDPTQMDTPQTIWESLEENARALRSLARIVLVMASIAVLLAITGVYGVLSFAVNQRTREFGVRMVLGANRKTIFRSIMFRGTRQIGIGLLCGVALAEPAAWVFTRVMLKNSPFPVRTFDPAVFGIAALVLVAVSLLAMILPALRATRVDPINALRTE